MSQSSRKEVVLQKTKKFFAAFGRFFKRCIEIFPITWLGLFLAAISGLFLRFYGLGRLDLLLLVISAGILALCVVCTLFVAVTSLILWISLRKKITEKPLHIECGAKARTDFSLLHLWFLPFLGVRWSWVTPQADLVFSREAWRLCEVVKPQKRGLYDEVVRAFEVYDLLGIAKIKFYCTEKRQLKILPSTGALRHVEVVRSVAGGDALPHPRGALDGDRFDMRHYNPGDPLRFVLWKVFAKSRDLMVRTPERALSPIRQTAAYVVAGRGDEPAAGSARAALEAGAFGEEWILGADGVESFAKSKAEALEVLTRSGTASAKDFGAGLDSFLRNAAPGGVGRAVIFVPAFEGDWVPKVLAAVKQKSSQGVSFIVCADTILQPNKKSWLSRFFWKTEAKAQEARSVNDLKNLLKTLQKINATCTVVDRQKGQFFSAQHLLRKTV